MKTIRGVTAIAVAVCALGGWSEPATTESATPETSSVPTPGEERAFAGVEMIWVPQGEFMMGSEVSAEEVAARYRREVDWLRGEHPRHKVSIEQGFWMGKYEVTNAQFRRFRPDHDSGSLDGNDLNGDEQPVAMVSWNDAQAYIEWLNRQGEGTFRLPSEAEWEYACRAGTTTTVYWGVADETTGAYANVADRTLKSQWSAWPALDTTDGYKVSAPVGQFRPNPFGLYDTIGNVCEWCQDRYHKNYRMAPTDGQAWESATGEYRVARGGSWGLHPYTCRAAYRSYLTPSPRDFSLGFRVARTL